MPVYFILDPNSEQVKIGRAQNVHKRNKDLQTGNPGLLQLLGWIFVDNDVRVEQRLHQQYQYQRGLGEWFHIGLTEVLNELKREQGFVPTPKDSFEIVGYDRDAIPEYVGVCIWNNFEIYECCPFCGCLCGMHEQEETGMYHCINCDAYTNFDFLSEERYMWPA